MSLRVRGPRPGRFPLTSAANFFKFEIGPVEMPSPSDKISTPGKAGDVKFAVMHFASTHDTISAERLALRHGYGAEVVPRPPGDTGRCGVALRVDAASVEDLNVIFAAEGLEDFHVAEDR